MSTAKKAMLAVLLALTTVCAAVCSLLLAGSLSARAAEDRQPTSIVLNELSGTYGSMSGTTLIGNALSGTIYFNDNTSGPLSDYKDDSGYTLNLPDLRPTAEEALQESYTRQVSVSYEEGGRKETSKEITVTITWDEPTENSLSAIPQTSSFTAGAPIPDDAFNVQISYSTVLGLQTRTLTAGDYHFVYQGGGDTLEFGDESVTIVYTEGGKEFSRPINFSLFGIQVTEEPVNAPLPTTQASLTSDYTAAFQDFIFNNFNKSESSIEAGGGGIYRAPRAAIRRLRLRRRMRGIIPSHLRRKRGINTAVFPRMPFRFRRKATPRPLSAFNIPYISTKLT